MTYMLDRILVARLRSAKRPVLLLGARQVGKTTLLRALPVQRMIDLADESQFLTYARDPARLIRELRALKKKGLVAIDEVQRIPKLLNSVQVLIDEDLGFRFLLTGSSARKLKRGHANLLPGRILLEHLDPLTAEELGDAFDVERALQVGCLPGIFLDREAGVELLDAYAATYLREEIQAEAIARDVGSYSRFLDVAAACSGQWINYSKLASDSEIPKETIRRYFSILEDTLLAFRIPSFRPKTSTRHVSQRDKFVIFDIGVRNALLGTHRRPPAPTEKGLLFEQLVVLQCLYYSRAHRKAWKFSSYRTDAGAEVDLIIDAGTRLVAIECKAGRNVHESELRGLRSFEGIAGRRVQKYVVYQGERRQLFSKGEVAVPLVEFLVQEIASF
jgi:uncharacterized protein